jgi:hypothetical protein
MFSNKEIAEIKKRLDALESNVSIYPTKDYWVMHKQVPINEVLQAIVNYLQLDIVAVLPTYRKVELKAKQVPPTTSTGEIKWNGGL